MIGLPPFSRTLPYASRSPFQLIRACVPGRRMPAPVARVVRALNELLEMTSSRCYRSGINLCIPRDRVIDRLSGRQYRRGSGKRFEIPKRTASIRRRSHRPSRYPRSCPASRPPHRVPSGRLELHRKGKRIRRPDHDRLESARQHRSDHFPEWIGAVRDIFDYHPTARFQPVKREGENGDVGVRRMKPVINDQVEPFAYFRP